MRVRKKTNTFESCTSESDLNALVSRNCNEHCSPGMFKFLDWCAPHLDCDPFCLTNVQRSRKVQDPHLHACHPHHVFSKKLQSLRQRKPLVLHALPGMAALLQSHSSPQSYGKESVARTSSCHQPAGGTPNHKTSELSICMMTAMMELKAQYVICGCTMGHGWCLLFNALKVMPALDRREFTSFLKRLPTTKQYAAPSCHADLHNVPKFSFVLPP